ncbi:FAD/NAD(P)-binding domain-containing protein [Gonapodya prolifera JEL478]|uniref:FAD/NAD(P)-binding domain-containing protein n=1 Tax=Gonapodya prolifera (strain JEL478) TaxID=1344416 RepID=A0A139A7A4_GONPJ|nr:FAD/NAD(P)-binding domain-containing protein [Gonapodya prolifera JEL478]|eukprot:KXS12680.1 FAD/NAD(P)-binding domain-containing protein [Gonapodya prolifera JEL478]
MSIATAQEALNLQLKPQSRSLPDLPQRDLPRTLPTTDAQWRALEGAANPQTRPDPFGNATDREIFGLSPPPVYPSGVTPRPLDVVVIGCGLSGMTFSMMSRWRLNNVRLRIFEKNPTFGGTWFENRYPGCRCDVPSVLYSFRFEPFDWTEGYAQWDEIFRYFSYVFHKYRVSDHVEFSSPVVGVTWNEAQGKWTVEVEKTDEKGGKHVTEEKCDVVINAQGLLNRPKLPSIPGLESFQGHLVHSSQWDSRTCIVEGKRVGVIGNGSTGIQIAGDIAKRVARMDHFCKTPTWVAPYASNFSVTASYRDQMLDPTTHAESYRNAWVRGEKTWVWWTRPNWDRDADRYQATLLNKYLAESVSDPQLRAKMTPGHGWGCRRPIMSNNYYSAIQLPTSHYINDPIVRITPRGILVCRADGTEEERELDMIVCATGFAVNWVNRFMSVRGKGGVLLADLWKSHPVAYRTVAVHGFPNYFWVAGPNTPPTHNSVHILFEQQINYIFQCIVFLQTNPSIEALDVKESAQKEFSDVAQEWLNKYTVWNENCGGWYRYETGYIVQWPGSATHMMESLHTPNWDHYELSIRQEGDTPGPATPMSATGWHDRWRSKKNRDPTLSPTMLGAKI